MDFPKRVQFELISIITVVCLRTKLKTIWGLIPFNVSHHTESKAENCCVTSVLIPPQPPKQAAKLQRIGSKLTPTLNVGCVSKESRSDTPRWCGHQRRCSGALSLWDARLRKLGSASKNKGNARSAVIFRYCHYAQNTFLMWVLIFLRILSNWIMERGGRDLEYCIFSSIRHRVNEWAVLELMSHIRHTVL